MPKATKFGTFAGVFTPSILTILGVIMYLRLGWVVGEGGLIMTIGIILLAHIISVSTGLSISSIATDKKIKTGGIYYILSRSLGLPMGGAIGITLFIGTALSIALYIVGFTENLLSVVPQLSDLTGVENSVNQVRLIGTIVIFILVILAFISTSLVIKTQYFILGAIALSLLSIVFGFFTEGSGQGSEVLLKAASEESSFEDLFKVFFPAVTGFTAGVAMSGDLANPKRSIPLGTMASIIVGFVIYILLAIGIAFFVDRELLLTDSNFLMQVAWFSPLVVMGIWGATLSSALGGILGGPRILQAIANDRIMPKFLGKGFGASNEPRNALIVIFLIAEIGILIGELNIIAGVVSMFYLASYGFINLAFSLESWASTDFRPSFKINPWIGFVGFVASFAIMFKLDTVSMFAALIIMSLIFIVLKRKEFRSDAGDVWQSVWTSIVRRALHKMEKNPMEERNWQPNIILFSGGSSRRPYLVDFGKTLVGKFGMLSNFDLIEKSTSEILFPKHKQAIKSNSEDKGIFYRRQTCKDIYQGIEVIASTYGFSGIEPNTILMGWARQSKDPVKFGTMIRNLYKLDLNILLMDYDKRFGFGDKKSIDIWWRGEGHNNNLALFLAKFMISSNEWENAKIRLLIISSDTAQNDKLYKKANYVLENLRISADVKIINNQLDTRHVYDIIGDESNETSMVFLGIPQIEVNQEEEFIKNTNKLLGDIGTVVLVKASSFFMSQKFITKPQKTKSLELLPTSIYREEHHSAIDKYNLKFDFSEKLSNFFEKVRTISEKFRKDFFEPSLIDFIETINAYSEDQKNYFTQLLELQENDYSKSERIVENIFEQAEVFFENINDLAAKNTESQKNAIQFFQDELNQIIDEMPDNLYIRYSKDELKSDTDDSKSVKKYKRKLRLVQGIKGSEARNRVKFKKILRKKVPLIAQKAIMGFVEKWDSKFYENVADLNKTIQHLQLCLPPKADNFSKYLQAFRLSKSDFTDISKLVSRQLNIENELTLQLAQLKTTLDYQIEDNLSQLFDNLNINQYIKQSKTEKNTIKELEEGLEQLPEKWNLIYQYFFNEIKLDNVLGKVRIRLFQILQWFNNEINKTSNELLSNKISQLKKDVEETVKSLVGKEKPEEVFTQNELLSRENLQVYEKKAERCIQIINNLTQIVPEKVELLDDIIFSDLKVEEVEESKSYTILASRLTEGIVSNDLKSLFHNIVLGLIKEISEFDNEIINQNRLIKYTVFKDKEDLKENNDNEEANINSFLEGRLNETKKLSENLAKTTQKAYNQLLEGYFEVNDKLQLYAFKREASSWNQYLTTATAISSISTAKRVLNTVGNFIDKQIDEFWYRQSDAILLAEDLSSKNENEDVATSVYKLLNITEKASISKKILSDLPFFYKHLFLDKNYFNNDFWVGRGDELQRAVNAHRRFSEGFPGALMITGTRNSGKSFLIRHLCSARLKLQKAIYVTAPELNANDPKQLLKQIQNQTGQKGSIEKIIKSLEKGTVMVFEDIELWWEKSENGNSSLVQLFDMIEKFSNKIFFIISINSFSYHVIRKMLKIEPFLLDTIPCKPMNSRNLQEIILFRHRASGFKFELDKNSAISGKTDEEGFRSMHFAVLFSKYFNYSRGNIGMSLLNWMSNISSISDNKILMNTPRQINTSELEKLDKEMIIMLYQLVLHKRMDISKITRVMLSDNESVQKNIDFLLRSGLIVKTGINYEINAYLQNAVVTVLKNHDIL
jgi:amino acid transporter